MEHGSPSLAEYFDGWYADMAASPVKDKITQRHPGLPPHLESTGLLGWQGIAEVTTALDLSPGGTLLDLACGRAATASRSHAGQALSLSAWTSPQRRSGRRPPRRASSGVRPTSAWATSRPRGWRRLEPGDDPALRSFRDEGISALERFDSLRRVMATATAPPER